ncbi:MAG TPA: dephospho-CoA kinase [Woeseiaceae bacterium]|nr:dephospho-CoA kinase [Woeseiaceae bacterium]
MTGTDFRPLRVGLTGGIASGKSVVADMFAALGAVIIDTDVIAREVVMPGQPALDEIRNEFGPDVIGPDGSLDRRAMRKRVFEDEPLRLRLEEILHPRIRDETFRQASKAGGAYQVIVVPLLAESPLKDYVDRILVVDCDEDTQVNRLLERDAETMEQAQRILAAQASREERLAIADDVIDNSRSLEETRRQVAALHDVYIGLQGQSA